MAAFRVVHPLLTVSVPMTVAGTQQLRPHTLVVQASLANQEEDMQIMRVLLVQRATGCHRKCINNNNHNNNGNFILRCNGRGAMLP